MHIATPPKACALDPFQAKFAEDNQRLLSHYGQQIRNNMREQYDAVSTLRTMQGALDAAWLEPAQEDRAVQIAMAMQGVRTRLAQLKSQLAEHQKEMAALDRKIYWADRLAPRPLCPSTTSAEGING
ncbi:MAG: hypothetical protein ACTHJ1_09320 [Bordetella sp.]|uniref:hypothetical protein n=1 Tax=Bordetella sp. TaxID=28081 RepID=UPI003F7CA15A